jgi:hypothetical protein
VHAQSAYTHYRWKSSSTIAIDQAGSPPLFVTTNHFHSKMFQDLTVHPPPPHNEQYGDTTSLTAERAPATSTTLRCPNSAQHHIMVNGTLQTCHNVYWWQSTCNHCCITLPLRMCRGNGNGNLALPLCHSRGLCDNTTMSQQMTAEYT